jgi:hypothetical protein
MHSHDMASEKFLIRVAGAPWYSALVTFLSFIAALLGSIYTAEIKSAFPFYWGGGHVLWPVVAFWLLGIAAALMFWSGQHASNKQRAEAEERLIARTEELGNLVRTLPPADFLAVFSDLYEGCSRIYHKLLEAHEDAAGGPELASSIRYVLFSLLNLLRRYEAGTADTVYAANIMLYRPMSRLTAAAREQIRERTKFLPAETDFSSLRGVLDVVTDLSTTTRTEAEVDASLSHIALPVPVQTRTEDGSRWRVLPGAPLAFCEAQIFLYHNPGKLSDWCREHGDFQPSVIQMMDEYFQRDPGRSIGSFVSIPLPSDSAELHLNQIGVLNIHCNKPGLLEQREPGKYLWPLIVPFRTILTDMVRMFAESQGIEFKETATDGEASNGAPPELLDPQS